MKQKTKWTPSTMGKKGGENTAKKMTKKQRVERATNASRKAQENRIKKSVDKPVANLNDKGTI